MFCVKNNKLFYHYSLSILISSIDSNELTLSYGDYLTTNYLSLGFVDLLNTDVLFLLV